MRERQAANLVFFYDAGHGWLRIYKGVLEALGIAKDISRYSYIKDEMVYLEEDCDAGKLLKALKESGREYNIAKVDQGHNSPIRNYRSYVA